MPEADRHWKLYLAAAVLSGVGAALYLAISLASQVVDHWPLTAWPPQRLVLQQLNLRPLIDALPFLLAAPKMRAEALRARDREAKRAAALRGDFGALPRARLAVEPSAAPDVTHAPLELTWRGARRLPRRTGCLLAGGMTLSLVLTTTAAAMLVVVLPRHVPVAATVWLMLGATFLVFVPWLFAIVWLRRRAQTRIGGHVIATTEGLLQTGAGPSSTMIPWHDARLLEVVGRQRGRTFKRAFILYGAAARITWYETPAPRARGSSPAVGSADACRESQALLNVIVARTGLSPRTLSESLMDDRATGSTQPSSTHRTSNERGCLLQLVGALVVIGALAVAGCLAYTLPFTNQPLANLYVAGSLLAVAIWILVTASRHWISISGHSTHGEGHIAEASAIEWGMPPSLHGPAGFAYRRPVLHWVASVVPGILLALNALVLILAYTDAPPAQGMAEQLRSYVGTVAFVHRGPHRTGADRQRGAAATHHAPRG